MTDKYTDFFLNSSSAVVQYELLEIDHSSFDAPIRLVRNDTNGLTVTLETSEVVTFVYCPLKISQSATTNDLDFGITIDLGDVGDFLQAQLDQIQANDSYLEKPSVVYRTYRSDDLTQPMLGPFELEIEDVSFNKEGATFEAKAPSFNLAKTGALYTIDRFPMMAAFL